MKIAKSPKTLAPSIIIVCLLGLQVLLTEQAESNENLKLFLNSRILDDPIGITCSSSCTRRGAILDSEMIYRITLSMGVTVALEFKLDDDLDELSIKIEYGVHNRNMPMTVELQTNRSPNDDVKLNIDTNFQNDTTSAYDTTPKFSRIKAMSNKLTFKFDSIYSEDALVVFTIEKSSFLQAWVIPVAAVGGLLALITIAGLAFYYKWKKYRRMRQLQARGSPAASYLEPPQSPQNRLHESQVQLQEGQLFIDAAGEDNVDSIFPAASFRELKRSFSQKACTICLEELQITQTFRQLGCEHIFHSECVRTWLRNQIQKNIKPCCPNCNHPIEKTEAKANQ